MSGSIISVESDRRDVVPIGKGYVFLSYVQQDKDIVERLKKIIGKRKFAYWDYLESDRDYHGALYLELEEKIKNAAEFITIISDPDEWRESKRTARECTYAEEAKVPIFVIQAKPLNCPMPLIINQLRVLTCHQTLKGETSFLRKNWEKKDCRLRLQAHSKRAQS